MFVSAKHLAFNELRFSVELDLGAKASRMRLSLYMCICYARSLAKLCILQSLVRVEIPHDAISYVTWLC